MSSLLHIINRLRRPKVLIRAARIGATEFRRERDLKRVLKTQSLPQPETGLPRLLAMEEELETTRRTEIAAYNVTRHVEVLTALLAEAQLLPRPLKSV
ncbi:MAG: DUF6477 family protein [Rhodobacteraceae bacterium]|nr:DUF6477 family protein [Paracoccaceae bacterium]